jgi:hypothetical protein
MRITVSRKGNVGGGLADLWERAGHQVTRLGRAGGDVSDADAVLVAVPGGSIAEAFDRLTGVEGETVIDATNRIGVGAPDGFASNCRVREVQDGRADREVVQRQLRIVARPPGGGEGQAEQPLVRRRGGARGGGAAQPTRVTTPCTRGRSRTPSARNRSST